MAEDFKLCKNCKWISQVHLMAHWATWECEHPNNLEHINLVTGDYFKKSSPQWLRTHGIGGIPDGTCGPTAGWYEPASFQQWREQLGTAAPEQLATVPKRKSSISLADLE